MEFILLNHFETDSLTHKISRYKISKCDSWCSLCELFVVHHGQLIITWWSCSLERCDVHPAVSQVHLGPDPAPAPPRPPSLSSRCVRTHGQSYRWARGGGSRWSAEKARTHPGTIWGSCASQDRLDSSSSLGCSHARARRRLIVYLEPFCDLYVFICII